MTHTHACHLCGDVWDHDAPEGDSNAFEAAHTCRNGHRVTVKYEPDIARGLAETCKAGGDAKAYLSKADPMSLLWIEAAEDSELSSALDQFQDGRPLYTFPPGTISKVCSFMCRFMGLRQCV